MVVVVVVCGVLCCGVLCVVCWGGGCCGCFEDGIQMYVFVHTHGALIGKRKATTGAPPDLTTPGVSATPRAIERSQVRMLEG